MGLSAKNAILMVEFGRQNFENGTDPLEATVFAAHQRLRPILMTSMAFILGVMLSATILAIFFIPLFLVAMLRLFGVKRAGEA